MDTRVFWRYSPVTTLIVLCVVAVLGTLSFIGCGAGSKPYSPVVKGGPVVTPDFTVAVTPSSVSVAQGATANYTVTLTSIGGFASPITLAASGLPVGAAATFGALTVTATGATATLAVSTSNAPVQNASVAKPGLAKTPASSRIVTPAASSTITVTASGGGLSHTATATLVVTGPSPDFTVAVSPASVTVSQGASASYTVTLTSVGGFDLSTVTLSVASGLPAGAKATFGAPVSSATQTTEQVTVSTSAPGSEVVTPTGTSTPVISGVGGGFTHTASTSLVVTTQPDFTIKLSEATTGSGTIITGGTGHFIATVTSVGSFATPVALSLSGLPQSSTAIFGSATVTPTASGATTTVDITTNNNEGGTVQGVYPLTLTAVAGAITHTTTATLNIGGFNISVTEASAGSDLVSPGQTAHYIITVKSINGFAPPVTLVQPALPEGCTATFGTTTLTPTAAGATTTLTITTSPATPTGQIDFGVGGGGGGYNSVGFGLLIVQGGGGGG